MVKKTTKSKKAISSISPVSAHKDWALLLLRIALGWLFLYSGLTKIMDPAWNASGFLIGAKTFTGFFSWFASAENIGWVNTINAWGQALIGLSLVTGTLIRISSVGGVLLMLLYYFPGLDFPLVKNGFIVDDHIIYIFIFFVFASQRAGTFYGLDSFINKKVKSWWV